MWRVVALCGGCAGGFGGKGCRVGTAVGRREGVARHGCGRRVGAPRHQARRPRDRRGLTTEGRENLGRS